MDPNNDDLPIKPDGAALIVAADGEMRVILPEHDDDAKGPRQRSPRLRYCRMVGVLDLLKLAWR